MENYFKNRNFWAVILGGSSGMGLAVAQKLAAEGMNLCIVHRDRKQHLQGVEENFETLRQQHPIQVLTFNEDALRADKMEKIIATMQAAMKPDDRVHLLFHAIAKGNLKQMSPDPTPDQLPNDPTVEPATEAAYQNLYQRIRQTPYSDTYLLENQDFMLTLQAMAVSWYDWTKALLRASLFAPDARLLGMTSEGSSKAWRGYAAVSAAKATMESLCRSMALEFAPFGLRCNTIQAGVTDTPSLRMIPGSDHLKMNAVLRNPFHRLTTPEDVANAVFLLVRDEAAWINGANIPVDGGERIV